MNEIAQPTHFASAASRTYMGAATRGFNAPFIPNAEVNVFRSMIHCTDTTICGSVRPCDKRRPATATVGEKARH